MPERGSDAAPVPVVLPYIIAAIVVGAVFYPLTTGRDSFPLSTYPMFSHGRHDPELTVDHVVGRDERGEESSMPPELLGTDEVLQAKVSVRRAVQAGPSGRKALCERVAQAAAAHPDYAAIQEVEVRRAKYDAIRYYTENAPPLSTRSFARCAVKR